MTPGTSCPREMDSTPTVRARESDEQMNMLFVCTVVIIIVYYCIVAVVENPNYFQFDIIMYTKWMLLAINFVAKIINFGRDI